MRWHVRWLCSLVAGLLALALVIQPAFAALHRSHEAVAAAGPVAHDVDATGVTGHDPSAHGVDGAGAATPSSCPIGACTGSCTGLPAATAPACAAARAPYPAPVGPDGSLGLTLPPETPPPIA